MNMAFMRWSIPPSLLSDSQTGTADTNNTLQQQKTGKPVTNNRTISTEKTSARTAAENKELVVCSQSPPTMQKIELNKQTKPSDNHQPSKRVPIDCLPVEKDQKSKKFSKLEQQFDLKNLMSERAENYVRRWLRTAQPDERQIALDLFTKTAVGRVPGKQLTFTDLLAEIRRCTKTPGQSPHPDFTQGDGSSALQYIKLQTTEKRRDRWMYTTWHHLPPYNISEANALRDNRGSHYARPRRYQPPDYVIHPDMD